MLNVESEVTELMNGVLEEIRRFIGERLLAAVKSLDGEAAIEVRSVELVGGVVPFSKPVKYSVKRRRKARKLTPPVKQTKPEGKPKVHVGKKIYEKVFAALPERRSVASRGFAVRGLSPKEISMALISLANLGRVRRISSGLYRRAW